MKKRLLSLFLAAVLIFGALPAISLPASAAADMTTFTEVYDLALPVQSSTRSDTDGDGNWDRWNSSFDVSADGKTMTVDSDVVTAAGLCSVRQLEAVDHKRDLLLKQTISVEAMPTSNGGIDLNTGGDKVKSG